jgi:hypothetical protein
MIWDGHQSINRDLYGFIHSQYKDSHYRMDDHKPYIIKYIIYTHLENYKYMIMSIRFSRYILYIYSICRIKEFWSTIIYTRIISYTYIYIYIYTDNHVHPCTMFDRAVVCCFRLFQDMGSDIQLDGQDGEALSRTCTIQFQLPWYQHDMLKLFSDWNSDARCQ